MTEPKPFLIRHPDTGAEYELADVAYFVSEYKPKGFAIVDPAPTGYAVPELPKPKKADPPKDDGKDDKKGADA